MRKQAFCRRTGTACAQHFTTCLPETTRSQGRTREEAFRIGAEIAATVTEANPAPVTLKFEKVRPPCHPVEFEQRFSPVALEEVQLANTWI